MSQPNAKSNKTDPKKLEIVKAKPEGKTPAKNVPAKSQGKPQLQNATKTPPAGPPAGATRITKRNLWWKEPPSEKKIPPSKPFKPTVSTVPRIDDKNLGFQPAPYNGKKIETQALNWTGNSVVDTWQNINHQPGGYHLFLIHI